MTCERNLGTDTSLMLRVQGDASESFAALISRNRTPLFSVCGACSETRQFAKELTPDVFVRVYRARASYQPTAKFSTCLYRITTNVARNYFRDEKRTLYNVSLDFREGMQARREAIDHALLIEDHLLGGELAAHYGIAIVNGVGRYTAGGAPGRRRSLWPECELV
jgi:RNA polymerase sigma-70 factor (ECF subfamily)